MVPLTRSEKRRLELDPASFPAMPLLRRCRNQRSDLRVIGERILSSSRSAFQGHGWQSPQAFLTRAHRARIMASEAWSSREIGKLSTARLGLGSVVRIGEEL